MKYAVIMAVGSTNHGVSCGIDQRKIIRWEISVNITLGLYFRKNYIVSYSTLAPGQCWIQYTYGTVNTSTFATRSDTLRLHACKLIPGRFWKIHFLAVPYFFRSSGSDAFQNRLFLFSSFHDCDKSDSIQIKNVNGI